MSGMHLTASGTATRRLTGTGREAGDGAGGWSRDRYGRVRSRSTSGGGMTRREGGSGSELRCSCKDASTVPQTDEGRGGRIASGLPLTLRTSMQLTPSAGIGKGTIPFPSSIGSVLLAFARAVAGYHVSTAHEADHRRTISIVHGPSLLPDDSRCYAAQHVPRHANQRWISG